MEKPTIKARFVLDDAGQPVKFERGGVDHYKIDLQIEGAPATTYAVTYMLDETYYERVRESREEGNFKEELTSYGDYVIQAKIRSPSGIETIAAPLSGALEMGHAGETSPAIQQALSDIKAR